MPHPLRRRTPIPPADITIRRIGTAAPIEVVTEETLLRRKEEARWREIARARGEDLYPEHQLLALKKNAVISVPDVTADLWWFVSDINGIDRTIAAATFLFAQPVERTFPFEFVTPIRIWRSQHNEIDAWIERLDRRRLPSRQHARSRAA